MPTTGVYAITNQSNGRRYIGATGRCFRERWSVHKRQLRTHRHPNPYLQADYDRCGPDAFEYAVVEVVTDLKRLGRRERFWINKSRVSGPIYNRHLGRLWTRKARRVTR